MKLADTTTTCWTCSHHTLVVMPPSTVPVSQCWSPDLDVVGAWYMAQVDRGPWVLMGNCRSYDAAGMDCPR